MLLPNRNKIAGQDIYLLKWFRPRRDGSDPMNTNDIKALTFDTGGTILDWHTGFATALKSVGEVHQIERDWGGVANDLRRRSLGKMANLGEHAPPQYNFDDAHRMALDEVCVANGLDSFTEKERYSIWWDVPSNHCAHTNNTVFTNSYARFDYCSTTNYCIIFDYYTD